MAQTNELKLIISAEVDRYITALNKAESQTNSFGSKAKSALMGIGTSLAAGFGIYELVNQLKGAYLAAEEVTRVNAKLEAVLKATGYSAGLTSSAIDDMATKMMDLTGVDDEVIKSAQTVLLTFRNIGKDVFPEATQAMLDMSAVMGQDLQSSAVQLGKALNDPIEGVSALRRVGVQLTQQQEDQIKVLVKNGQGLEAQKIILEELKKEFGGAAAASKTFSQEITTAFGNLQESVGQLLGNENAVTGYLRRLAEGWQIIIDKIRVATTEINKMSLTDAQTKLNNVESDRINAESKYGKKALNTPINKIGGMNLTPFDSVKSVYQKNLKDEAALNARIKLLYKQQQDREKSAAKAAEEAAKNKNRFNTGGKGSDKDKSDDSYKSLRSSIDDEKATLDYKTSLRRKAAQNGVDIEKNEYYKAVEALAVEHFNKLREIESSEASNKGQLKLKTNELYDKKASELKIKLDKEASDKEYELRQKAGEEKLKVIQEENQRFQDSYNKKIDLIRQYENERLVIENSNEVENYLTSQGYSKGASYFSELKKLYEDFRLEEKKINEESLLDEQQKNEAKLALNEAFKAKNKQIFADASEKDAEEFRQIWGNAYEDLFSQQRSFADISKKLMLDLAMYYMKLTLQQLALSESTALKEIALNSTSAIISAIKAVVGIPVIGPALAVGAAAGTAALIASYATKRAYGGGVKAGEPYIVGDGGKPEVFIPRSDGAIFPDANKFAQRQNGESQNVSQPVVVSPVYHINALDSKGVEKILKEHTETLGTLVTKYQAKQARYGRV
jgi:hypothetical protein